MSGQGLADSAASQNKNLTFSEVDFPSLINGRLPAQGIRAKTVQLCALHPDGVNGFCRRRGGIHPVYQGEHGILVGQGAVPSQETRLFQAGNGDPQVFGRDLDPKVFCIQSQDGKSGLMQKRGEGMGYGLAENAVAGPTRWEWGQCIVGEHAGDHPDIEPSECCFAQQKRFQAG